MGAGVEGVGAETGLSFKTFNRYALFQLFSVSQARCPIRGIVYLCFDSPIKAIGPYRACLVPVEFMSHSLKGPAIINPLFDSQKAEVVSRS